MQQQSVPTWLVLCTFFATGSFKAVPKLHACDTTHRGAVEMESDAIY